MRNAMRYVLIILLEFFTLKLWRAQATTATVYLKNKE